MTATAHQTYARESSAATVTNWMIDPARSTASFAVANRFMLVMNIMVNGTFTEVNGVISLDESKIEQSRAEITINASTIDTHMAKRDAHLKSADFFHVDRYPQIKFLSTSIAAVDRGRGDYQVNGLLTIRNVSHAVTFDLILTPANSGNPQRRLVLSGKAIVDRREFGLGWSKPPMSKPSHQVELAFAIEALPTQTPNH